MAAKKTSRKKATSSTRKKATSSTRKKATSSTRKKATSSTRKKATSSTRKATSSTRKATSSTRRNPGSSTSTARRKNSSTPCRCPRLSRDFAAGDWAVLRTVEGAKLEPVKRFTRKSDAQRYLRELPDRGRALLLQVDSTYGG